MRRKTLTDQLARRILQPVDGDLVLDLRVACGVDDMERALARVVTESRPAR